ncbi:MAG: tRNA (adenosine(37)-N6)-threonylcarbamoyltransferase complex transferase subunit TsaD [Planctomycetes bacterium]|jgi:N6-L-threonylcarbamoyladenine synthase|nr:tRNA (adenosine(37)-N6)-threonylcarbamoyltransferase complex transferase subunit TsaD [Planctomycetota bacterium]HJM58812.1 tRNA (adenosine(37)-N6)-threonylcarbamoyltransferase complex transferase subunit TsaD [Planctomycetota bacterium]
MTDLVLGIESSCDDTAAAVVRAGHEILSSVVHTQAAEHAPFGGVVPEIAGRSHLRSILPVVDEALDGAGVRLDQLAGIAVTHRPGLVGSLLVGLSAAKALAFTRGLPLVGVHHIEAHVYAATMEAPGTVSYPCVALVVSGGHTALYRAESPLHMTQLAATLDDAAGEAFDKVAYLLGLPYPGGPSISALAEEGDPTAFKFPRYRAKDGSIGFSFSGLKTAVLYHVRGGDALAPTPPPEEIPQRADVAASFQETVVENLVRPTLRCAQEEGVGQVLVAGGVACNQRLREVLGERGRESGLEVFFPSPAYSTDNAAMIAGLGWQHLAAGARDGWDLDAHPS